MSESQRPRCMSTNDSDMVAILDQVAPALNSSLDSPASHDVRQFALQLAINQDDIAVPTFPSPFPTKTPAYPDAGFTFPLTNSPLTFTWPAMTPFDDPGTINLDRMTTPASANPASTFSLSRCPSPMPSEAPSERSDGSSEQHDLHDNMATTHPAPARGRKRRQQLEAMTEEERALEAEIRAERNRQSARDCRVRKKSYIRTLQTEVERQKAQLAGQADAMAQLRKENERVTAQLNRLRKLVEERARKERLGRSA